MNEPQDERELQDRPSPEDERDFWEWVAYQEHLTMAEAWEPDEARSE